MANSVDGIVLLAKQSGITSFSSLWQIKNALGTKKIGHTGTLDTFAEGLIVALAGKYTRLVPYFSATEKEYLAEISFGVETDTLDPDGAPVAEAPLPTVRAARESLRSFTGEILQKPPVFSALHVEGQRASDLARKGFEVDISPRVVSVYELEFISAKGDSGMEASGDDPVKTMVVRVLCSKGTYVRALARDIAYASGSRAHLSALRRTRTGPFTLDRAAGVSLLSPFPPSSRGVYGKGDKPPQASPAEILASVIHLDSSVAKSAGLSTVRLDPARRDDFSHGKKPSLSWFEPVDHGGASFGDKAAVFCSDDFMGVVTRSESSIRYDFVAEGLG